MNTIHVSPTELRNGRLDDARQAEAVRCLEEDGFVVLADVVDLRHIEILRERVWLDLEDLLNRPDTPFNWTKGNIQQDPPPFPPYLFRDVLVNDVVVGVTHAILGNGLYNSVYSGNTALPSDQRQPVHADVGQLWPHQKVAHPAYGLVVNVPLVDMSAENGSTEIWPGTHLDTSVTLQAGDITVASDRLEAQRAIAPPIQPTVKAGSVVIRDIRLWHAGMPNRTQVPRPMIAMIHWVSWWQHPPLRFPKGTEELFEHPVLYTHAEFVEEELDHIRTVKGFASEQA